MVCQNQSIDDSDAPLARDLRLLVRERLKAGDSDAQVLGFLTDRYGQFVLLKPKFGWDTALLWGAPAAVLLLEVRLGPHHGCSGEGVSPTGPTPPLSRSPMNDQRRLDELAERLAARVLGSAPGRSAAWGVHAEFAAGAGQRSGFRDAPGAVPAAAASGAKGRKYP